MLPKLLCLFLLTALLPAAHAQTGGGPVWCPPGATWTYSYRNFSAYGDVRVAYARDTTVAGRPAQILTQRLSRRDYQQPAEPTQTQHLPGLITAADADRVYLYANNQFYTLYDFSARPGNSWLLVGNSWLGNFCTQNVRAVVDSAGQQLIAGQLRRWIRVHTEVVGGPAGGLLPTGLEGRIYEGIGPVQGYLLPQGPYGTCGFIDSDKADGLLCFQANGLGPIFGGRAPSGACTVLGAAKQHSISAGFGLYPNPATTELALQLPASITTAQLTLQDVAGRIIWCGPVPPLRRLNVGTLPRGLYVAILKSSGQPAVARRLLLQ